MSAPPSPAADLVDTLVVLRAVMADERRAISRLDLAAVESLTARKHALVEALERLAATPLDGEGRRLIARVRLELSANVALVAAARDGVAALLGRTPDDRYDRRARRQPCTEPLRTITL